MIPEFNAGEQARGNSVVGPLGTQHSIAHIASVYNTAERVIGDAARLFPPFTDVDHHNLIAWVMNKQGVTREGASSFILGAISSNPQLAKHHSGEITGIMETHGVGRAYASNFAIHRILLSHKAADNGLSAVIKSPQPRTQTRSAHRAARQPSTGHHSDKINEIMTVYRVDEETALRSIKAHHQFSSLNHHRVLRQLTRVGRLARLHEAEVIAELMSRPRLAELSVKRYLAAIDVFRHCDVSGIPAERLIEWYIRHALLSPYVPGTDRLRITQAMRNGQYKEDPQLLAALKRAAPRMRAAAVPKLKPAKRPVRSHSDKINEIMAVYGVEEERALRAVASHHQFADLNQHRVLRQLTRIGRLAGISEAQVKEELLESPRLASLSSRRYLAALDVFRHCDVSDISKERLLEWAIKNSALSPYVPGTDKLRITQATKQDAYTGDPALLTALQRRTAKLRATT